MLLLLRPCISFDKIFPFIYAVFAFGVRVVRITRGTNLGASTRLRISFPDIVIASSMDEFVARDLKVATRKRKFDWILCAAGATRQSGNGPPAVNDILTGKQVAVQLNRIVEEAKQLEADKVSFLLENSDQ